MIVAGIDEAGDAVPEQLRRGQRRRQPHVLVLERRLVGVHALEQERLRVGFVRQAARELERGMQVAVDKARRRHRPHRIDRFRRGIALGDLRRLADGDDLAAAHRDRRIADDAAPGIDRDEPVDIRDDKIDDCT